MDQFDFTLGVARTARKLGGLAQMIIPAGLKVIYARAEHTADPKSAILKGAKRVISNNPHYVVKNRVEPARHGRKTIRWCNAPQKKAKPRKWYGTELLQS